MNITIHCDTSFNKGKCCTGYILNIDEKIIKDRSSVFHATNNNEAEITGILIACKRVLTEINIEDAVKMNVYNDNIVAVTVSDSNYTPSNKAKKKFTTSYLIKDWCKENKVHLHCMRKRRNAPIMKECDKLSKVYRKTKEDYEFI